MRSTHRFRRALAGFALILPLFLPVALAAVPTPAAAISIVPECARNQGKEAPDLNCALATFENIANLILGITGSFALLMFIYGGFMLLTSQGVEGKVSKGKTIILNAVIGIVIIMLAGYIVRYAVSTLQGQGTLTKAGAVCGSANAQGKVPREYKMPDGSTQCATSCNELSGYSCTTDVAGKNCLVGLCEGSQNVRCCPQ